MDSFNHSDPLLKTGWSDLATKWVRLGPNWTNPWFFQIIFQYILARWAKMYWNLIWKSPIFVPLRSNLTHFKFKSGYPELTCITCITWLNCFHLLSLTSAATMWAGDDLCPQDTRGLNSPMTFSHPVVGWYMKRARARSTWTWRQRYGVKDRIGNEDAFRFLSWRFCFWFHFVSFLRHDNRLI